MGFRNKFIPTNCGGFFSCLYNRINVMKKIEYLYGVKVSTWSHLPYKEALRVKIKRANQVIALLNSKSIYVKTNEDSIRVKECIDAIKFNERLLHE